MQIRITNPETKKLLQTRISKIVGICELGLKEEAVTAPIGTTVYDLDPNSPYHQWKEKTAYWKRYLNTVEYAISRSEFLLLDADESDILLENFFFEGEKL
jgi:hypothetical protein